MAIGEWQEYVSSLEKETPGLDAHVKRLYSEFEAAKISLAKVAGQLDYGRQLVSNAKIKLRELEAAKETNRLKLEELRGATESDDALISAMATEGEALQWKLDSQYEVLNAFRGMRGMGEMEELDVQVKCVAAEEAWKKASARQGLWKQHKKALECQLKKMRSGFSRLCCIQRLSLSSTMITNMTMSRVA
jgi:chromosome segregation ATPase